MQLIVSDEMHQNLSNLENNPDYEGLNTTQLIGRIKQLSQQQTLGYDQYCYLHGYFEALAEMKKISVTQVLTSCYQTPDEVKTHMHETLLAIAKIPAFSESKEGLEKSANHYMENS